MTDKQRRAYGDWQTPQCFADRCCRLVRDHFGFEPDNIVEPTCGMGNFIAAARKTFDGVPVLGIEIDNGYIDDLHVRFDGDALVTICQADYLQEQTSDMLMASTATLVVGNPPWVTNATLGALGSDNLPMKTNFKGLRGIDAMTGESNFDICEWMILRTLHAVHGADDMLALLCKASVARNVCVELAKAGNPVRCTMLRLDAKAVFDINAGACLFVCDFRAPVFSIWQGNMSDPDAMTELEYKDGNTLVEVMPDEVAALHGKSTLTWRQGVKHDCGRVMELARADSGYTNKLGEVADIEDTYLYPLVKSSKSRRYVIGDAELAVPMTQKTVGEDTAHLETDAPRLWAYLTAHGDMFDGRKSSVYRKAPRFAMFGVGDYSYAPYKVAVSGFYKQPVFAFVHGDKPIMFDDTCYFIPFDNEHDAKVCMLLLNSEPVLRFLASVAFLDSKRPYAKKVLAQLDFAAALDAVGLDGLNETATRIGVPFRVTDSEVAAFRAIVGCTLL